MLDIRLLREKPEFVKERLAMRDASLAAHVDAALQIDEQRRTAETEKQKLQSERNRISKEIGIAKKKGEDTAAIESQARAMGERIEEVNREAEGLDTKQRDLLLRIPNLPHDGCPPGSS